MKKIQLFAIIAIAMLAGVFTACNKDLQNTTTKKAAINPLKDVPEGTTYTVYGQTEENLANEEVCQMQLTMGKDGGWTVKREIIPNRMLKSAVNIQDFTTILIPEKYISFPDNHTAKFDFPINEDIKYYFIPFKMANKKAANFAEPVKTCTYYCVCKVKKESLLSCELESNKSNNPNDWTCKAQADCTKAGASCQKTTTGCLTDDILGDYTCTFDSPGVLLPAMNIR